MAATMAACSIRVPSHCCILIVIRGVPKVQQERQAEKLAASSAGGTSTYDHLLLCADKEKLSLVLN